MIGRCAALFLIIFGLLPIVNWIPGGRTAPWYASVLEAWLSGGAIVVGAAIVLAILSSRVGAPWKDGLLRPITERPDTPDWRALGLVGSAALGAYLMVAWLVFDGRPLHIDEIAQVLQARIFAAGRLWAPSPAHPEFTSTLHMVDAGGKVFSQFPPGGPAMLALGEIIGTPWVVGPAFGAASTLLFGFFVRTVEPRPAVRLGAVLLFAFAPFTVFMTGSYMNHVPTLTWLLVGMLGTVRAMEAPSSRPLAAALGGLGFGCAATIRPLDALAFAFPAGVWYLTRAVRDRRRMLDLTVAGLAIAVPVAVLLWANWRMTGHPLRFGYQLLWGANHGLGFHASPWGAAHTPLAGLELVSLYLLRLQTYLFEFPLPSLLPATAALALARRLDPADRFLLAGSTILVGAYFAYWHDGFYLGPRFMYPLLPLLALWSARLPSLVRERIGAGLVYRGTIHGYAICVALALLTSVPVRARQYQSGLLTMRWDADSAAAAAGVRNALVLVRESWGAQLVARLQALGVPRPHAEQLYQSVDACVLETAITGLERNVASDPSIAARALPALIALTRDSARTIASPWSSDATERFLPGTPYSARCRQRLQEDRDGFTVLAPLLLARGRGNRYVRDLHGRNLLLLDAEPDRPVYLLRQAPSPGSLPKLYPVSRDSLRRAARAETELDASGSAAR